MIGSIIKIDNYIDSRGSLLALNSLPFDAQRIFFISDVPQGEERGNHFSKTSCFLYLVIKGGCAVELDNGESVERHELKCGDVLFFPRKTWMRIYDFCINTVLCVLSDNEYRPSDYISDYEEFLRIER